jgi:hypothetical protein
LHTDDALRTKDKTCTPLAHTCAPLARLTRLAHLIATTTLNIPWSGRHLHAAAPLAAGQMGLCLMSHAPVVMRQVAPAGVYSGVLSVAKDIMAKEGLKGFYRGLVPVIVRAFPANAACFLVGVHCLFLPCHCQPCHYVVTQLTVSPVIPPSPCPVFSFSASTYLVRPLAMLMG